MCAPKWLPRVSFCVSFLTHACFPGRTLCAYVPNRGNEFSPRGAWTSRAEGRCEYTDVERSKGVSMRDGTPRVLVMPRAFALMAMGWWRSLELTLVLNNDERRPELSTVSHSTHLTNAEQTKEERQW